MARVGKRIANNAGRLAAGTTGGNDLLHTLPTGRTAIIRKVIAYNPAASCNLQIGTLDRTVPAANFVQLLPILRAIGPTLDNEWTEDELPEVKFAPNTSAGAAGRTGDIYVLEAGGNAVDVILEVEELGA